VCDDGNPCTVGDACQQGACVAGVNTCECQQNGDCAKKEDGNACNGTLYGDKAGKKPACLVNPATLVACPALDGQPCLGNTCDPVKGACKLVPKNDGKPCDDGSLCTGKDTCAGGQCAGVVLPCDGKDPCTVESCAPQKGCQVTAATYSDGNACTQDACDPKTGTCGAKATVACNDGNACTSDGCDPLKGCTFLALYATPCAACDGCVAGSVCDKGQCVADKEPKLFEIEAGLGGANLPWRSVAALADGGAWLGGATVVESGGKATATGWRVEKRKPGDKIAWSKGEDSLKPHADAGAVMATAGGTLVAAQTLTDAAGLRFVRSARFASDGAAQGQTEFGKGDKAARAVAAAGVTWLAGVREVTAGPESWLAKLSAGGVAQGEWPLGSKGPSEARGGGLDRRRCSGGGLDRQARGGQAGVVGAVGGRRCPAVAKRIRPMPVPSVSG
jgi:hypothetical protein